MSLVSCKTADFQKQIEEVYLEFGTRAPPFNDNYMDADLNLPASAKQLLAAVLPDFNETLGVDAKAFRIYGNSHKMHRNRQAMKLRNIDGDAFQARKLVGAPIRIAIGLPRSGTWVHQVKEAFIWILKNL